MGGTEECGWELLNNAGGSDGSGGWEGDGSWGWEVLNNAGGRYCIMRVGGTEQCGWERRIRGVGGTE